MTRHGSPVGQRRLVWSGATLLTATSLLFPVTAFGDRVALIMGGTGNPGPDPGYVADVDANYIQPLHPGYTSVPQFTAEQGFPLTPALGTLTFDQSVAAGVSELRAGIEEHIAGGNDVVVFGYSQSSTVATNVVRDLAEDGDPHVGRLAFVLVGDPNNPNGGLFERFAGLYIPIFDETFNGATPSDTAYPTDIYTVQYDGYADAPQYPLNLISTANALMGALEQHFFPTFAAQFGAMTPGGTYPALPGPDVAVELPTSPDYYTDCGQTHYYEILSQNLPLLDPLRMIPFIGTPLAELVQPDLRVIVDLGYGHGYADIATPAGLFPLVDPLSVLDELAAGARQGVVAALVAAGGLPDSALPDAYPYLPSVDVPWEVQSVSSAEAAAALTAPEPVALDPTGLSAMFETIGL